MHLVCSTKIGVAGSGWQTTSDTCAVYFKCGTIFRVHLTIYGPLPFPLRNPHTTRDCRKERNLLRRRRRLRTWIFFADKTAPLDDVQLKREDVRTDERMDGVTYDKNIIQSKIAIVC